MKKIVYEPFEKYQKTADMTVYDFLINFDHHVAKLRNYNIKFPEHWLVYRALKIANLSQ